MYSMTDTVTHLPYSVIMVESSNTSRLLPRQACAVESAVRCAAKDVTHGIMGRRFPDGGLLTYRK